MSGEVAALVAEATAMRQSGRALEAARILGRAAEASPNEVTLWNHLGLAERAACRAEQALAAFRRAARLSPDDIWAETNMAFSLMREPGEHAAASFAPLARGDQPAEIDLAMFCDRFPHTYGFLIGQYATYLERFPDARAYSFGRKVMEPYGPDQFEDALAHFRTTHPALAERVHQLVPDLGGAPCAAEKVLIRMARGRFVKPRLGLTVFAMNADLFRPLCETLNIGLCCTLNPGGGFRLNDPYSDDRLARVFASPCFRHAIVTYRLTRDYVMARFGVPEEKLTLIPGTIVMEGLLSRHQGPKHRFPADKNSLDLCFAGLRYSPTGADKGYDRFIEAAAILARRISHLRLHVIGNFDETTYPLGDLAGRITFHGQRDQAWMAAFYSGMDVIVSPNVANQLAQGAFDGFPVTSCIEAGMCGVALAATDPMGLNDWLDDGRHFIAIPDAPDGIAQTLAPWLDDPQRLYRLAETGRRRFVEVWGEAAQMTPRLDLIGELVARERAGA